MKQLFSIEEFTAQRRVAQEKYAKQLAAPVAEAIASGDWDHVLKVAADQYVTAYRSDTAEKLKPEPFNEFMDMLSASFAKATPDSDVETSALLIATAALNFSALAATDADPEPLELQWVDMDDDKVRKTHAEADGQTRPPGEPFEVGGFAMRCPGDTTAPISEWIRCRCAVRPVRAEDSIMAALQGEEVQRIRAAMEANPEDHATELALLRRHLTASSAAPEFREVSPEEREKDADAGRALPDGSFPIDNCDDLKNAIQAIGRAKDPAKAKAHIRKRKNALGCPDVEIPETWATAERPFDLDEVEALKDALTAASLPAILAADSGDHSQDTSLVVVALPAEDEAVHAIGDEPKHVTLAYMGDFAGDPQGVHEAVDKIATEVGPFSAAVSGHGQLGPKGAKVLFVEAPEIATLRRQAEDRFAVELASGDAHPHFVPHMTIDYGDEIPAEATELSEIKFDRLAIWRGGTEVTYPLGVVSPDSPPLADVAAALDDVEPVEVAQPVEDEIAPVAPPTDVLSPIDADGIPVHGILAPEGVPSGDGRGFREGALSNRPLPLPGTYQSKTAEGHDHADLVFMIEKIAMIDGAQHWSGHMRTTPEADVALGVLVDFGGRFGLSVDADSAVGEYDENDDVQWFSEARSSGAAMVNIPRIPRGVHRHRTPSDPRHRRCTSG